MGLRGVFAQRNVWVMALSMALFGVSFGLWVPFLPLYILELGATATDLGLVFVVSTLSRFILQLPGGFLADRFGRRKVIVYASLARVFPPLIYYFAQTWEHVILGMAVNAIGSLYLPAFRAILAESLPEKRRGLGYGFLFASFSLTQASMPPLGGWIMDSMGVVEGIRLILVASFATILGAVAVRIFLLEETLAVGGHVSSPVEEEANFLSELREDLLILLAFSCFVNFALQVASPFLAVYAVDVLGLSKTQWGFLVSAFGITSSLFRVPGGVLSDRIGRKPCIILASAVIPLRYLSLLFTGGLETLLPTFAACGVAQGIYWPTWSALLADTTSHQSRGRIFGVFGAITGIASGPASYIGGWAWNTISPAAPFIINATFQFIGLTLFVILFRPKTRIKMTPS